MNRRREERKGFLTPLGALGGAEAVSPAPPALERRKQASGTAMLTPARLCGCFCLGSMPDVQWVWPRAQGSRGSAFCCHQRRRVYPSCEQGGGCQLQEGLWPTVGPCPLLQVMYFSSLFPYVVLACFLVRGLLLRGAVDGILHMFTPKVRASGSPGTRTALLGLVCFTQFNAA